MISDTRYFLAVISRRDVDFGYSTIVYCYFISIVAKQFVFKSFVSRFLGFVIIVGIIFLTRV